MANSRWNGGSRAIANQLTDEKVQTPAQRQNRKNGSSDWHLSTVKLILQSAHQRARKPRIHELEGYCQAPAVRQAGPGNAASAGKAHRCP